MSIRGDTLKYCGRKNQKSYLWMIRLKTQQILNILMFPKKNRKLSLILLLKKLILMKILICQSFLKIILSTNTYRMISATLHLILWSRWNTAMIKLYKTCLNSGIFKLATISNLHLIPTAWLTENKISRSSRRWFLA